MKQKTVTLFLQRPARVSVALLAALTFMVGSAGGIGVGAWWWGSRTESKGQGDKKEQLYTCGMHPQVMQKEPGLCPICEMKLTPMKTDGEDDSGSRSLERRILYWRAPMDPNYISERPGKSPMGMDLVPVYSEAGESSAGPTVRIDSATIQNMGLRSAAVGRGPLVKTIRSVGRVDYDERSVTFVNTKFDGWIKKLHVDETGARVEKGDPLFDVYSDKLHAAQGEFLAALKALDRNIENPQVKAGAQANLQAVLTNLRERWGVTEEQIRKLRETREAQLRLSVPSPASGIVTDKHVQEGMYITPGMRLYTIADLSHVWVYVDVYEYQLPWVRVGQTAKMSLPYVPGKEFIGRVVYIYPYLEKQSRVIKVRLEFDNPGLELKPDMYANVTLEADLDRDALLVPREAYIDSGKRKLVFLELGGGKFQPREIQVGVEAEDGMVEVLYGLDEGDVVVTSGHFLIDAEAKLKEAVAKMREVTRATPQTRPSEHAHDAGIPENTEYACPMETHPDQSGPEKQAAFYSAEPGKCEWCGMTLKPLEELKWVQARRAAGGGDVAYTCPDHPHVFSEASGDCPRCGKPLVSFKAMYTCPDPEHAGVVSAAKGACPDDGRAMVPFRGVWLDETMADQNAPARPAVAEAAAYRCPVHPLVHSDRAGRCTICGAALKSGEAPAAADKTPPIPTDAKYVCPMEECRHFAATDAENCPKCGMMLKPIEEVEWARQVVEASKQVAEGQFVCPMHSGEKSPERATCPICGMQLVSLDAVSKPTTAPAAIAVQMNYLMEHYLEIQKRFASDRTVDVARNALGLISAADEINKQLAEPGVELPKEFADAVEKLRAAALKTNGKDLEADRVTFVDLSAAMRALVERVRPDSRRYPEIYIYHCPMSKGDWLQAGADMANPYYGFKMLDCGELQSKK